MTDLENTRIGVIGLGYVGLPLAVYMSRHFPTAGFDIDAGRIEELAGGFDRTREVTRDEMLGAEGLRFTAAPEDLAACNFYIVTVPTPVDKAKQPDLSALEKASSMIGPLLGSGDIVVYESTVFPGATEEVCVPILEQTSGLKFNRDFFAGYSPERINPGDKKHRLPDILKITSGSTPEAAKRIDAVYAKVITAGTHKASSIRVAEAAKVIENIQRDLNIALVNELALLFKKLGIETRDVLAAAGTKWNFHDYQPGLVGGHCIGVDPYYLTHKAQSIGYHPEIILAGRRINDSMAAFVANDIISVMLKKKLDVAPARLLLMGFTFKENCPDTRNTKIADLVRELQNYVAEVVVLDPQADPEEAMREHDVVLTNEVPPGPFDGAVIAVKHAEFLAMGEAGIRKLLKPGASFLYDIKGALPEAESDARLY